MYRPDEYVPDSRIAADLGASARTVYNWQKRGILPSPVRIGPRTKRTLGADLNAALERIRNSAPADSQAA